MAATAMMEEVQQEEEAPALGAADAGEAIGAMDVGIDVEQLPPALQQLVAQLREVPPTIQEVDLGGPDQGGDYFRMHPPAADAGALWCSVRLWVLELIGRCPSLRVVKLGNSSPHWEGCCCGIRSESEVERLCQGLKSNDVLRWLRLDGNVGFGSDFGCAQVSHILANSNTSLQTLEMDGVGLGAAGLSQVLSTLLANTASRLRILDVEHNPDCLADERASQLLAQLVSDPRTTKCLRQLRIRETGLAVPGAALLSAALGAHDGEESTALEKIQVGGSEPILNVIVTSLGRCSKVHLLFSKEEEAGPLAETLAQMLRTNTNLREVWLGEAHFSTQAWRCVFQALGANSTLSYLGLEGSTTLDHSVMDDLHQLRAGISGLTIGNAPLKGGSLVFESDFFYCTCSSCDSMVTRLAMGEGGEMNVERLPTQLRPLIAALTAVPPSIEEVDLNGQDHRAVGHMFRLNPVGETSNMLWELRLLVLGLIGRCSSLRAVKLEGCNISRESEVERLCQGLTSNTVLQHLVVNGNLGFGSDSGCRQVSRILASSSRASTSLQQLEMWAVGMKGTGLSQLLGTLLANKQWELQLLDVGGNPECLANDDDQGSAVQLLAQLLLLPYASSDQPGPTGTACRLRELKINGTGLSVAGATRLSAALAQNRCLQQLVIGPEPILRTILMSSSSLAKLRLVCSKEEAGLAEALAQMLRTNTTLRGLWLQHAHFSAGEWRCIFEALAANKILSYLSVDHSTTLDHNVIDDLSQLCSVCPGLYIDEIVDAPLKGSRAVRGSKGLFTCSCTSCAAGGTGQLKRLIDELSAPAGLSMARITRQDWIMPLVPRSQRSEELSAMRRRVFSLVGSCASLKSIQLPYTDVIEEEDCEDVEALCAGMQSNPVLEELILDGNRGFGTDSGCTQLARVVSGCIPTLRKISLQAVGMKSSGLGHLVQALLATRGSTSVPTELIISGNSELGNAGAHLVEQLLISSGPTTYASSLTTLEIGHIGMGMSGAHSVSLALKDNTSLRSLGLGEKGLDGPTALLLHGLISNHTLTHLDLWKGGMKPDKGLADILAQVLQSSGTTALRHLKIHNVPFQPEEWRKVFGALEKNQVLKVLEVKRCYHLEPVFNDHMHLLQVNTTIEEIHLEGTDLEGKGKIPIVQEALRRNKQQREYVNVLKAKLPLAQPSTGRLFLCGAPYAGKSTLRETMVRCHQQPQGGCTSGLGAFMLAQPGLRSLRPRTEGIEIQVLRKDADMQISVWDMAGQEQYHALHDCIFPTINQACIFVFVYNPSQNKGRSSNANERVVLRGKDFYEKLLYWLRFITSNSLCRTVLPIICIVISNFDRLQPEYTQDDVVDWATKVVNTLRDKFKVCVRVSECISVVKAYSTVSVQPVVAHLFQEFEQLLKNKLPRVFKACGEMSLALARLTTHPNAKVAPMVRLVDFYKMCSDEVEALRELFQDQPTIGGNAVQEYVAMARAAVAAYLHDVGSIVYFKELDFVVVNPNWLSNVFLSKFMRFGANTNTVGWLPRTEDGLIEESELRRILANFLKKSQPACPGFGADDLLKLLLKLEFCYKEHTSPSTPGVVSYFVPNSVVDQNYEAVSEKTKQNTMFSCFSGPDPEMSNPTRQVLDLEWKVPLQGDAESICTIGIRLQCDDNETKFLTAGFFSRLQVCLCKALVEVENLTLDQYDNRYNLIRARINGCEILVESSGEDNATFLDILVRSAKSKDEVWVLVQKYIIQKIQAFCATPQGCAGVNLLQRIIRPECVGALTPCLHRDTVSVEALKIKLVEYILSNDAAGIPTVGDASYEEWSYQHCWPENSNFSAGYSKVVQLLDAQALKDVLRRVMVSLAQEDSKISQAADQVMEVMGSTPQDGSDEGSSDSGRPNDLQKQPSMLREIREGFKGIHSRLDEHRDILSNITPNLIRELKLQQRQMKDTLNEVMSFLRDSQNTRLPRFPYLSERGVGMRQRFVAFLTVANAWKLHFMCENRSGIHYVANQPGCDVSIEKTGRETLRFVTLCSLKILYILVRAGFQVGAGLGGIVPEYTDLGSKALPINISSQAVANVLNDIKPKDPQFFAPSAIHELAQLHSFLRSEGYDDITKHFQLHRVEYLPHDAAGKLPKFGWVCQKCRERGKTNNSLIDFHP